MNMRLKVGTAVLSFCALGCTMQANAAENEGALTLTVDNDVFTGSDNNYTNGLGVTWVSAGPRHLRRRSFRQQVGPTLVVPALRRG